MFTADQLNVEPFSTMAHVSNRIALMHHFYVFLRPFNCIIHHTADILAKYFAWYKSISVGCSIAGGGIALKVFGVFDECTHVGRWHVEQMSIARSDISHDQSCYLAWLVNRDIKCYT